MTQRPAPPFGGNPFFNALIKATQDQAFLGKIADSTQPALRRFLNRGNNRGLKRFLNGTWVGHPLHPVLTDIPVGAWTMAAIFDALALTTRDKSFAKAAAVCVGVGIGGAVAAAAAGLADWSDTDGRPKRVGLIHATCNSAATIAYAASLAVRRSSQPLGAFLGFSGYALATLGAGLGGHLVYGEGIGVNHAVADDLPIKFRPVMRAADLLEKTPHRVSLHGRNIVLVKYDGEIYALLDSCPHLGGPLSQGKLEECSIRCPWHGSRFALEDGRVLEGPATLNAPTFATRLVNGRIEVRAFESESP
jgi:nitrite reductase/ring-hydroxylating ferredoxin subunit/uncharacterized membrane protein